MFFFFKQKTAYEMRISDWSSDVCSSDLPTSDPLKSISLTSTAPWPPELRPGEGQLVRPFEARQRTERFPQGADTRAFRSRFFPEATPEEWNDWRWQLRNHIRSLAHLERIFQLSDDEHSAISRHKGSLPVGITPTYASLMSRDDAEEPLRRTHIDRKSTRLNSSH